MRVSKWSSTYKKDNICEQWKCQLLSLVRPLTVPAKYVCVYPTMLLEVWSWLRLQHVTIHWNLKFSLLTKAKCKFNRVRKRHQLDPDSSVYVRQMIKSIVWNVSRQNNCRDYWEWFFLSLVFNLALEEFRTQTIYRKAVAKLKRNPKICTTEILNSSLLDL